MFQWKLFVKSLFATPARSIRRQPSRRRPTARLWVERLEDRTVPSAADLFTPGNIAVLQVTTGSDYGNGTVLELNSSTQNQSAPVQTIPITSTGPSAMTFSDSGTSSFLADTNDQSLLTFGGYNIAPGQNISTPTVTAAAYSSSAHTETLTVTNTFTIGNMVTLSGFSPTNPTVTLVTGTSGSKLVYSTMTNPNFTVLGTVSGLPTDISDDIATNARAVGTLAANDSYTLQTNYTESTPGNQTRSATSTTDSTWYISDKGGLFTNGSTSNTLSQNNGSTNILNFRSFGGTAYVSSTKFNNAVNIVSSPTATSVTGLNGIVLDADIQDFYLIQSGQNGTTYDILYTIDQSGESNDINKFCLNTSTNTWVAYGSSSILSTLNDESMIAANDGNGGSYLYVLTSAQSAQNSLMRLTDTTGYDQTINISSGNDVTLYTATGTNNLKGIDFAPVTASTTTTTVTTTSGTQTNPNTTLMATVTATSGSAPSYGMVEFWSGSTLLGSTTSYASSSLTSTFTFTGSAATGTFSNVYAVYIAPGTGYPNSASNPASGPTITVNAPAPTVTMSTAAQASNAATLTIAGTGFSTNVAQDSVAFNLGAVGTVTSANATSLTVSFTSTGDVEPTLGNLTAVVTANGESSGSAVQVATVVPGVTLNTGNLPNNATLMTIAGAGFDTNTSNDSVSFSDIGDDDVTGVVTSVNGSGTLMTVSITGGLGGVSPGTALYATVTADGETSASEQVATVQGASTPTVTSNSNNVPNNASSITIDGTDFDTDTNNDSVTFSNGVTGTVTSVNGSGNIMTVGNLSGLGSLGGGEALSASVTVDGVTDTAGLVQVATVQTAPSVTSSTANLPDSATSITINGANFDPNANNDSVTFSPAGVTGVIMSVNGAGTSMTVTLTGLGAQEVPSVLDANVAADGYSSGSPVQVATIAPLTISYGTSGSSYTQDFSTLPVTSGEPGNVIEATDTVGNGPFDLTQASPTGFGASGLSGWYSVNLQSTTAQNVYQGEANSTTGALFDFNDGTAGSQSLGTISTASNDQRFGALLVNNTGATLSQFTLSYTGEEWWDNSGTGRALGFSYELGATGIPTSLTPAGTQVASLGFSAPDSSQSGMFEDAYTNSAFQVPVSATVSSGFSWAPGETLAIFWDKGAGASTSDGLGVSNVNFYASTTPTVTVTDASNTYDGGQFAATNASVTSNGTTVASFGDPTLSYQYYQSGTLLASAPTSVGSYTVIAVYTSNNLAYTNATSSPVPFTISPEAITITANNQTQNYGSVNLGTSDATITSGAVQTGDSIGSITLTAVDINSLGVSASGNDNVGTWGIEPSAATGAGGFNTTNYDITYAPGTLTIDSIGLTVSGISSTDQTYNGTTSDALSGTPVLNGYVAGDNVSLSGTGVGTLASENAGDEAVTVSGFGLGGNDAGDYTLAQPTVADVTISQEGITIKANNQTQTYGSVNLGTSDYSITAGAVQTGDSISSVTLSAVDLGRGVSSSGNENVGTWGITPSSASGTGGFSTTNYNISYTPGTLNVAALGLTVSGISSTDQTYNGTTNDALTGTPSLSDVVSGDNVTLTGTGVGTLTSENVGSEPVTVSGYGITGTDAHDYSFSQPTVANATISQEAITITANDQTQTYGSVSLGTTDYTVAPGAVQTGDSITSVTLTANDINSLGTSTSGNDNVGAWGNTPSAATGTGGFNTTNYDISYAPGSLTIDAAPLTIAGISGTDKVYDGSTNDPLSGTPVLSGNVSGDMVALGGIGVGTLASPNAGTEAVTISGYNITGSDAHDYNFSEPTVPSVTISMATPTITWANPADIKPGTRLSATQLDAMASVMGTFDYTPAAGTKMNQGLDQSLSVLFMPDDSIDYNTAADSVMINVWPIGITAKTTSLKVNATTLTISGFGFNTTPGDDTVTFSGGVTGTVTAASGTSLTVSVSNLVVGPLTASVENTATGYTTAESVQVATVIPVVSTTSTHLGANATSLTINGFGFDSSTPGNNVVTFSNGTTGIVTAASATQLTVTSVSGLLAGALKASVSTDGFSSGTAVEVASVSPVVTSSTATLAATATSFTINGYGFTTGSTVRLTGGTVGSVTVLSANQLMVNVTSLTAGALTAVVTSSGVSSGSAVQVAGVIPVVTPSSASLAANATSLTINGFGFSTSASNDIVILTYSDGSTAIVAAKTATATKLTVKLTGTHPAGAVYATVTVSGSYTSQSQEVANVI